MMNDTILLRFDETLARARKLEMREPLAMTLATANRGGVPSARVVLLRGFDATGFVFYTNSRSRKGREIAENSAVALCFHWEGLGEQIRIEGQATQVEDDEADDYWRNRPRESQLGAWASQQSEDLPGRDVLESRLREFEDRFANEEVPRPPHWTGYRVRPTHIEFWSDRPARLHDRIVYDFDGEAWQEKRLFP